MNSLNLFIDGTEVQAAEGQSVLDAALAAGIYIPHLCSHPDLEAVGGCKLCIVEVDGEEKPVSACTTPVCEGMRVTTRSPRLDRLRPIGTRVKVIPPVYVELTVRVSLRGSEDGVERTLEEALRSFLEGCGIGGVPRAGDIAALVQAAPGVLQVRRVDLRTTAPGCYQNADGDIRLPRQAIPRLKELQVERLPVERIGH